MRMFPAPRDRRALLTVDRASLAASTPSLVVVGGTGGVSSASRGLAVLLSFIAEDVLLLSQHAHVPQHVSHGAPVRPYPAPEQEVFTRSLRLPAWASAWLLHFDAHELHHMYPFVPGYRLRAIGYQPAHEVGWWEWVRRAKAAAAAKCCCSRTGDESGWDL